jgi:general stress protein 26
MSDDGKQLQDLVGGMRTAMLTSIEPDGALRSRPLTVQRVDEDGTIWFLVTTSSEWLSTEHLAQCNVAFLSDDAWVSATGGAALVQDRAVLDDLGDPVSNSWFTSDDPPAALRVDVEFADWWTAEGKLRRLVDMGRAAFRDTQPDVGDRGVVRP